VDKKESKANLLIVALPQAGGELPYGWLRIIHIFIYEYSYFIYRL